MKTRARAVLTAAVALSFLIVAPAPAATAKDEFRGVSCVRDYQGERPLGAVFSLRRSFADKYDGGSECFWFHRDERRRAIGVELRPGERLKHLERGLDEEFRNYELVSYRDDGTPYGKTEGERLVFRFTRRGEDMQAIVTQAAKVRLILVTTQDAWATDLFVFKTARSTLLIARPA